MDKARRANEAVNEYHNELGWGEREVTVNIGDARTRRIDIADMENQTAIEYKKYGCGKLEW